MNEIENDGSPFQIWGNFHSWAGLSDLERFIPDIQDFEGGLSENALSILTGLVLVAVDTHCRLLQRKAYLSVSTTKRHYCRTPGGMYPYCTEVVRYREVCEIRDWLVESGWADLVRGRAGQIGGLRPSDRLLASVRRLAGQAHLQGEPVLLRTQRESSPFRCLVKYRDGSGRPPVVRTRKDGWSYEDSLFLAELEDILAGACVDLEVNPAYPVPPALAGVAGRTLSGHGAYALSGRMDRHVLRGRRLFFKFSGTRFARDRGGRIYMPVQNLPLDRRRALSIGGEAPSELDFSACQARILYSIAGKDRDDPYLIPGVRREAAKSVLLISSGLSGEPSWPAYRGACLSLPPNERASKEEFDRVMERLLWDEMYELFCGETWALTQSVESSICMAILRRFVECTSGEVGIIPIHDGFLVPRSYEQTLRVLMEETWYEVVRTAPRIRKDQ